MNHGCLDFHPEELRMVLRNRERNFSFHNVPFARLSGTTDSNYMREKFFLRPSCRTHQSSKRLLGLRNSWSDRLSRKH